VPVAITLDTYAPYDSGPGSNVTEDGWRRFARHFRGDGVIRAVGSEFAPFGDSTGMQVKVGTGECWIRGQWGEYTTQRTLPIAAAHATLIRYDRVVLRNDFINNRIEADIKTGTAGAGAVVALTQNSSVWEIHLGTVQVDAAVVTIAAAKVTANQTYTDGSCAYTIDSGLQTVPNNAIAQVDWDVPQFNSSAVDRIGINGFTLQRTGQWQFMVNFGWTGNATGFRSHWVGRTADTGFTNRIGIDSKPAVNGLDTFTSITATDRFTAGESIAVYCFQTSGGGLTISNQYGGTRLAMYWLGP
jgi:hypothetical protein